MTNPNINPSIMNAIRRRELGKNPNSNIIPALPRYEEITTPVTDITSAKTRMSKLAVLASGIRTIARTNETEEIGEL